MNYAAWPGGGTFGGEATLPTGASIVVSAPVSGRLKLASTDAPLSVGQKVERHYPVFVLTPLLSPERDVLTPAERIAYAQAQMQLSQAQVDAEGQVQQARVQVDAAKIALDRAERLLREQAGNAKTVDDARAQLELAQKTLDAAGTRKRLVDGIQLDTEAGEVEPLVIEAPRAGIIRAEFVAPGQVASAGAPLFEIANLDPIWIRVPVYAGEVCGSFAASPGPGEEPVRSAGGAGHRGPTGQCAADRRAASGRGRSVLRAAQPRRQVPPRTARQCDLGA